MGMYGTYYSDICDKPSFVYWLYDTDGELLYVGLSTNPLGRLAQHRCKQPWGKQIARCEAERFPNRETAKSAERAAIHRDNPLHNIVRPAVV